MARAPDARTEQAKELFLSGRKLTEIARLLNVPEGTVRSWKNRYQWDCNVANGKRNVAKKNKGGQPGNRNAAGHGGTGPPGNKNAVTTGEFEALFFDCMNDEEKRLVASVPADKQRLLLQEIQLLTVRERRMLKRIEAIKESAEHLPDGVLLEGMTLVSRKYGTEKDKKTDLKEYQGKLGQIQNIEEALTRVQARKQRAIESLHKFGFDDAQLQIETKKLEMAARANGTMDDEETPDDGFMDALQGTIEDDWQEGEASDNVDADENEEPTGIQV